MNPDFYKRIQQMRGLPVKPGVDKPSDEQLQQMARNQAAAMVSSFASLVYNCINSALKAVGVINKISVVNDSEPYLEFQTSSSDPKIAYVQFAQRLSYIFSLNANQCVYSYNPQNGAVTVRTKNPNMPGQNTMPVHEVTFTPEFNGGRVFIKCGDKRDVYDSMLKMIGA